MQVMYRWWWRLYDLAVLASFVGIIVVLIEMLSSNLP